MTTRIKPFGIVFLFAWFINVPLAVLTLDANSGWVIYDIASIFAGALGLALLPIFFGFVAVVAGRDRKGHGLEPALVLSGVISIIVFFAVWRGAASSLS